MRKHRSNRTADKVTADRIRNVKENRRYTKGLSGDKLSAFNKREVKKNAKHKNIYLSKRYKFSDDPELQRANLDRLTTLELYRKRLTWNMDTRRNVQKLLF